MRSQGFYDMNEADVLDVIESVNHDGDTSTISFEEFLALDCWLGAT